MNWSLLSPSDRTVSEDLWTAMIGVKGGPDGARTTRGDPFMDALLVLTIMILGLAILAAAGLSAGVDSRDGFADDRLRRRFR